MMKPRLSEGYFSKELHMPGVAFLVLTIITAEVTCAADSDCWSFVWPGAYNYLALNMTAGCDPKNIAGGDEVVAGGGGGGDDGDSSGKMFLSYGFPGNLVTVPGVEFDEDGYFIPDPDPDNSVLGVRRRTPSGRAFGDEEKRDIDIDIPCHEPIVFTYNNSRPDIDAMMDMLAVGDLPKTTRCSRVGDQWCIKWTHYRGGNPIGISRFCGRAKQDKPDGQVIKAGCYTQTLDRYTREVCFCDNENMCNAGIGSVSRLGSPFLYFVGVLTAVIGVRALQRDSS